MSGALTRTVSRGAHLYVLRCSACPAELQHRPRTSFTDPDREDEVLKVAARAGWDTWKAPRKCWCPACFDQRKQAEAGRKRPAVIRHMEAVMPSQTTALPPKKPAAAPPSPPPKAEPPRAMDTNDRRVIFAKLDDVYLGPAQGYAEGWGDGRVAQDLGCARAWVSEVREAFFGPARDNEEIRAFLRDARKAFDAAMDLTSQAVACEEAVALARAAQERLAKAQATVQADLARIERRLADFERVVRG